MSASGLARDVRLHRGRCDAQACRSFGLAVKRGWNGDGYADRLRALAMPLCCVGKAVVACWPTVRQRERRQTVSGLARQRD